MYFSMYFLNPEKKTRASRQLGMEGSSGVGLTSFVQTGKFQAFYRLEKFGESPQK